MRKLSLKTRLQEETITLKGMIRLGEFDTEEIAEQKGIVMGLLFAVYYMEKGITNEKSFDPMDFYMYRKAYEEKEGIE